MLIRHRWFKLEHIAGNGKHDRPERRKVDYHGPVFTHGNPDFDYFLVFVKTCAIVRKESTAKVKRVSARGLLPADTQQKILRFCFKKPPYSGGNFII
ncbi:MAG TPA: hypothetical protein ENN41_02280 [Sediminispirochaeta sp.]|nr:hypothetical protein [Sediminispirochaeta sp.]